MKIFGYFGWLFWKLLFTDCIFLYIQNLMVRFFSIRNTTERHYIRKATLILIFVHQYVCKIWLEGWICWWCSPALLVINWTFSSSDHKYGDLKHTECWFPKHSTLEQQGRQAFKGTLGPDPNIFMLAERRNTLGNNQYYVVILHNFWNKIFRIIKSR